jgi:E3 ubiquitin-protein ligase BRE1
LAAKAKAIRQKVTDILTNISAKHGQPSEELQELRGNLTKLLASQKEQMVKFDRMRVEKEEVKERLESATLRFLKAEKKLDRAKSSAVAKLEQQAIAGTGNSSGSGISGIENGYDTRSDMANGVHDDEANNEASKLAYKEATAVATKQKEQLDELLAENKALTDQLTAANSKLTALTDDDYARTELFKNFKSQHEEVIKRINHLEATNIQLRQEAEKLQAERTAYRTQLQDEAETVAGETESQLQHINTDLTRVRSTRDELLADQSVRKASQEQEHASLDLLKELVESKDDRITTLESEIHRLRSLIEDQSREVTPKSEIEDLDITELRRKYVTLEQSFASVNNELPAMEKAYKRAVATASKKVMDFATLEEKVSALLAEKSKADQKYFAARKDMDIRIGEIRTLRTQNAKSSEIISQLKDVESANRTLLTGLEKQLADLRQANTSIMLDHKKLQVSSSEAVSKLESLRAQVSELTNLLKTKDSAVLNAKQRTQAVETELEQLRVRFDQVQKEKESWKVKSLSNQSGEEEMLRVRNSLSLQSILTDTIIRRSLFARSATRTSRTLFSKPVVTSSATIASRIALPID